MINKKSILCLLPVAALMLACSKTAKQQEEETTTLINTMSYVAEGDSMIYGLACDGCNDTLLVLLPDSGGDPVNYSIIEARRQHKVFGRPSIGDKMAVLVNPENPGEVLMSINLEQVKGTWYYEQLPEARHRIPVNEKEATQEISKERRARFDSMIQTYMVPREYIYTLKRDFTVKTEGGPPRTSSLDASTPVVYPPMKRYTEWHIHNGHIIFTYGGIGIAGRDTIELKNDTAEFIRLRRDTMVLQFADHVQAFKLKPDTTETNAR